MDRLLVLVLAFILWFPLIDYMQSCEWYPMEDTAFRILIGGGTFVCCALVSGILLLLIKPRENG